MIEHDRPTVSLEHARSSYSLKRFMSSISDDAIAVIDAGSQGLTVTTFGNVIELPTGSQERHIQSNARNAVVQVTTVAEPSAAEADLLPSQKGTVPCAIEFGLGNGCCDRLVFQLSQGEDLKQACGYLKRVWPILRQDCLSECQHNGFAQEKRKDSFSDNWDLLNRVDVAMLILTPKGQLARVNNAGKELLQEGNFLKGGNGGVFAASKDENCAFHRAVLDASTLKDQEDLVVFLTSKSGDMRVPVTLSRYYAQGRATNYIVAMLPTPCAMSGVRVDDLPDARWDSSHLRRQARRNPARVRSHRPAQP